MAADVAGRIVWHGDIAQLSARCHEDCNWALINDDPAASFAPGGCVLFLEAAECFRRYTDHPSRLFLRRALSHHLQGFFERTLFFEGKRHFAPGQIARLCVSACLRTAFPACKSTG